MTAHAWHAHASGAWRPPLAAARMTAVRGACNALLRLTHHSCDTSAVTAARPPFPPPPRPALAALRRCIVVDEGHRLKNADCKLSCELRAYRSRARLLLTGAPGHKRGWARLCVARQGADRGAAAGEPLAGCPTPHARSACDARLKGLVLALGPAGTPLQNKLDELWALLNFLMPGGHPAAAPSASGEPRPVCVSAAWRSARAPRYCRVLNAECCQHGWCAQLFSAALRSVVGLTTPWMQLLPRPTPYTRAGATKPRVV